MFSDDQDQIEAPPLFDRRLVGRLMLYVRPYAIYLAFAIGVLFVMAVTLNYLPVLIMRGIDDFLAGTSVELDAHERLVGIVRIGGIYLAIAAFGFGLRYAQSYLMVWVGQRVVRDLRIDIFRKTMRLHLAFFDRNLVGRLLTRVTSDVEAVQKFVTDGLVGLIADLFMLLGVMGFMFYVDAKLALTLFTILPLLFVSLTYINVRLRSAHRDVRYRQSMLNAYLQETISGMTTVQLFNRESFVKRRFDGLQGNLLDANLSGIRWFSYYFPTLEMTNAISVALVLSVGGIGIIHGSETTIGALVAFLSYMRDFFRPLEDLSEKSNILQQAMASSERIFALIDTPETNQDPDEPKTISSFRGDVFFDRVWFAYEDENWVLRDLSLRVAPGQSVALVGATGAGKTSITNLIARFYDIQKGTVYVDGHDVRDLRERDLRRRIGIVWQEPFIFSGTVAHNIDLHNPEITHEKVVQAARYVNAHSFIEKLPNGYATELAERGDTLSSGQKQLLALARALAQNPDILLILDEATASIDTETELLVQDAMKKLMQGRTSIIIAHRLSTIRHADQIYVMRHGEIIESGNHADLMASNGHYKNLVELLALKPTG